MSKSNEANPSTTIQGIGQDIDPVVLPIAVISLVVLGVVILFFTVK